MQVITFVPVEKICGSFGQLREVYVLQDMWPHRCQEHEPVIPSQCPHDHSPAVEATRRKQNREDRQGNFDSENERATRDRIYVVWRWPSCDVVESRECRHCEKWQERRWVSSRKRDFACSRGYIRGVSQIIIPHPRDETLGLLRPETTLDGRNFL
jgi:hypothetical protein